MRTRQYVLVTGGCLLLAAACLSPLVGTTTATTTTPMVTYMHSGFAAGPVAFTDMTGHLLEERRFEPFGQPIDARIKGGGGFATGAPDLADRDLNWLNKRTEVSTGWSDHGARWLAPETGRWLAPDALVMSPRAELMAAPWLLHPYQYVNQDPVAYWDPDGRSPGATAVLTAVGEGATTGTLGVAAAAAAPFIGAYLAIKMNAPYYEACRGIDVACDIRNAHRDREYTQRLKDAAEADAQEAWELVDKRLDEAMTLDRFDADAASASKTARAKALDRVEREAKDTDDSEHEFKMVATVRRGGASISSILIESHSSIGVSEMSKGLTRAISEAGVDERHNPAMDAAFLDIYGVATRLAFSRRGVSGAGTVVRKVDIADSDPGISVELVNWEGENLVRQ